MRSFAAIPSKFYFESFIYNFARRVSFFSCHSEFEITGERLFPAVNQAWNSTVIDLISIIEGNGLR